EEGTRQFLKENIMPLTKKVSDARDEILARIRNSKGQIDPRLSEQAQVDRILKNEYVEFNPNDYSPRFRKVFQIGNQDLVLPKHIDEAIKSIMDRDNKLPAHGVWDKSLKMFKFSVLFGPRHLAHVGLGGLMFMAIREPEALLHLWTAAKMVKDGTVP